MTTYNVHLYIPARVLIENVEADSAEEAARKVDNDTDLSAFFPHNAETREAAQWDEGAALGALVDVVGDDDYRRSKYIALQGAQSYLKKG